MKKTWGKKWQKLQEYKQSLRESCSRGNEKHGLQRPWTNITHCIIGYAILLTLVLRRGVLQSPLWYLPDNKWINIRESSKFLEGGRLPITKIFAKIYACNLVCSLELAFPYFFAKIPWKSHVSKIYFSRKLIFAYYFCIFSICSKFGGRAYIMTSNWRHTQKDGIYFHINGRTRLIAIHWYQT